MLKALHGCTSHNFTTYVINISTIGLSPPRRLLKTRHPQNKLRLSQADSGSCFEKLIVLLFAIQTSCLLKSSSLSSTRVTMSILCNKIPCLCPRWSSHGWKMLPYNTGGGSSVLTRGRYVPGETGRSRLLRSGTTLP